MDLSLLPIWVTSTASVAGVIYAIVRNGNRGKKADERLKNDLKNEVGIITKQLDDPKDGLSAIRKSVEEQAIHCARVSTSLSVQVKTNTDEIGNLRKKKR